MDDSRKDLDELAHEFVKGVVTNFRLASDHAFDNEDGFGNKYIHETARRIATAYREMLGGYESERTLHKKMSFVGTERVSKQLRDSISQSDVIVVRGIDFTSVCQHHWMPFTGIADVAYMPRTHLYGLSKIARIVEVESRKLHLQEHLADRISQKVIQYGNLDLTTGLPDDSNKIIAAACRITASHSCMACRGVRQVAAEADCVGWDIGSHWDLSLKIKTALVEALFSTRSSLVGDVGVTKVWCDAKLPEVPETS